MSTIVGNTADGKAMQVGGWYNGQQWNGSSLSNPGVTSGGQTVSDAVNAQTSPDNITYLNQLKGSVNLGLPSTAATSPGGVGLQSSVDAAQRALNDTIASQKAQVDSQLTDARAKETSTLATEQQLATPFRQDLETQQRAALNIDSNFQANQALTDELGTLLQQGNDLIKQQSSVTGLASVRNPRIQQTMSDITARAGVIQAVLSARNSQITVAENMIDRSIGAIAADRQDQITYYNKVLDLNRQDILSLTGQDQKLAADQIDVLKTSLADATSTADYVKKLLLDPATAQLMGQAGVSLNDSVEQINAKIQQASYIKEVADMSNQVTAQGATAVLSPKGVPAGQLITLTDSKGVKHYYQAKAPSGGSVISATNQQLTNDIFNKMTLGSLLKKYGNNISPDAILAEYNKASPWGQASASSIASYQKAGYNITTTPSATQSLSTDLRDAQAAIQAGADINLVRQRFLESHPTSSAVYDNYVQ